MLVNTLQIFLVVLAAIAILSPHSVSALRVVKGKMHVDVKVLLKLS